MKELKLIPPNDPRVQSAIAPFTDDMLKEHDFKDRQELVEAMFLVMKKFGGIGLTCNQVGLPFNMFVAGGHQGIEKGMSIAMFNPMIVSVGEEKLRMKEGCLTYPFLFLDIFVNSCAMCWWCPHLSGSLSVLQMKSGQTFFTKSKKLSWHNFICFNHTFSSLSRN